MINGKRLNSLQAVLADYSDADRTLSLRFPDETVVTGPVQHGGRFAAGFFSTTVGAVEVLGPWSDALSEHVGTAVRLVEAEDPAGAVDRGQDGSVSLISSATVERLTSVAGLERPVDARRFRMLVEIDGTTAHEEDGWLERTVAIGDAKVTLQGHVGRCLVTKLDPDTGVRDLETLDILASYRRGVATTEPLACGVYGTVLAPGTVRVGDSVELL
jgi:uncharacterized protein YcbX